uniref:Serpin family I member 2 n=1 Tax=Salvator merianae TaxID=96440 RepID=A0A8D0EGK4_SALMN
GDLVFLYSLYFSTGSHISRPMADGNTRFAVDLYQVLSLTSKDDNILCSPLGASLTLRTVHLGAKGKARQEIEKALNLQGNNSEAFTPLQILFTVTSERKAFTFNLANALYLQEGFMVKEKYLHGNKEFFQSDVKLVNFQDAKASAKAICTWVENKTDGKIKNFIASEDLGPLMRLLLVNGLFFKGNWKQTFKIEDTSLMTFTKSDGSITEVPMMHLRLTTKLGHFSDQNVRYQVLELPYKGEEFSFILILPSEDVAIEEVEKLITAQLIKDWFARMEEDDEVEIKLPRFEIEQTVDLKNILQSLNVTDIFNNGCDLSGITDSADVHISKAIQKVCIEVNEDGTEAASSSGMHLAAIMSMSQNQFVANRPFLFILKHNSTGEWRGVTNSRLAKREGWDNVVCTN